MFHFLNQVLNLAWVRCNTQRKIKLQQMLHQVKSIEDGIINNVWYTIYLCSMKMYPNLMMQMIGSGNGMPVITQTKPKLTINIMIPEFQQVLKNALENSRMVTIKLKIWILILYMRSILVMQSNMISPLRKDKDKSEDF